MPEISKVVIYDESATPEIQIEQIRRFITDMFSIEVESKRDIVQTQNNADDKNKILEMVSRTRIFDLKKQFQRQKCTRQTKNMQTKTMPKRDVTDDYATAIKEDKSSAMTL